MGRQRSSPPDPNAPPTEYEKSLIPKIFSDPSMIPSLWKAWIKAWLEENPPRLPYNSLSGAPYQSGETLDYVEFTSTVTITGTTEGGATVVCTGATLTWDGAAIRVIFFCPAGASDGVLKIVLEEDGTAIGQMGHGAIGPVTAIYILTPTAGEHTYAISGFRTGGASSSFQAGAGGAGTLVPGFMLIERA